MIRRQSLRNHVSLRRLYYSSETEVRQKISRSLDAILQDWRSTLDSNEPPLEHDYRMYRQDLRFRLAPEVEPGGLHFTGLWAFKIVRPVIRYGLKYAFAHKARMVVLPEAKDDSVGLQLSNSFKWRVERVQSGRTALLGGMAHYQFDAEGLVKSIQVDRLVPPMRPGLSLLAYFRLLQQQIASPAVNSNSSIDHVE